MGYRKQVQISDDRFRFPTLNLRACEHVTQCDSKQEVVKHVMHYLGATVAVFAPVSHAAGAAGASAVAVVAAFVPQYRQGASDGDVLVPPPQLSERSSSG